MEHSSKEQVFEILFQQLRSGGIESKEAHIAATKLTEAMATNEGYITNNEAMVEYKLIYIIEGLTKVQQLLLDIRIGNEESCLKQLKQARTNK